MKKLLSVLLVLLCLFGCALYFFPSYLPRELHPASHSLRQWVESLERRIWPQPEPSPDAQAYEVIRAIDGDTLLISIHGTEVTIRLIGIDAPESVHPDVEKNTPEGEQAALWLKQYMAGKRVTLEYDQELNDRLWSRTQDISTILNCWKKKPEKAAPASGEPDFLRDETMSEIERLEEIVKKLRSENGCPWDRAQTHETLKPSCIEEAAEVICGINILKDTGDAENLKEELGDLLFHVMLHAVLAEEEGLFTFEDVAKTLSREKHS